ncbi:hypothetical protein RRG08_014528 [Elysia crispata]|uniref:Uncharacterized protein n=1 Tax=Elysia crispata TaxID=231223 RepID=A0AAE1E7G0_9GAST|nr:hypothetical protein RRG08_014528 [Elysia crispata]
MRRLSRRDSTPEITIFEPVSAVCCDADSAVCLCLGQSTFESPALSMFARVYKPRTCQGLVESGEILFAKLPSEGRSCMWREFSDRSIEDAKEQNEGQERKRRREKGWGEGCSINEIHYLYNFLHDLSHSGFSTFIQV